FRSWAAAGTLAAVMAASEARKPRQAPLVMLIVGTSMWAARDGPAAFARWWSRRPCAPRRHLGAGDAVVKLSIGEGARIASGTKRGRSPRRTSSARDADPAVCRVDPTATTTAESIAGAPQGAPATHADSCFDYWPW